MLTNLWDGSSNHSYPQDPHLILGHLYTLSAGAVEWSAGPSGPTNYALDLVGVGSKSSSLTSEADNEPLKDKFMYFTGTT